MPFPKCVWGVSGVPAGHGWLVGVRDPASELAGYYRWSLRDLLALLHYSQLPTATNLLSSFMPNTKGRRAAYHKNVTC